MPLRPARIAIALLAGSLLAGAAAWALPRRHSISPMPMPLAQMIAIPSQVSGSGKCPQTSQPTDVALMICR